MRRTRTYQKPISLLPSDIPERCPTDAATERRFRGTAFTAPMTTGTFAYNLSP